MRKIKLIAPTVLLFASPWVHKLLFENLMLAWPGTHSDLAHLVTITATVMAGFVTVIFITAD